VGKRETIIILLALIHNPYSSSEDMRYCALEDVEDNAVL
jgi:hypothetical protein